MTLCGVPEDPQDLRLSLGPSLPRTSLVCVDPQIMLLPCNLLVLTQGLMRPAHLHLVAFATLYNVYI